ncbi:MAG: transcriptional regulator [Desulfurococcales archaeon]|nr:transcriptional regulator [Desulfurococcales archaeon]
MTIENTFEVDFSKVPIKPMGAKEVRELEIALIIGTLFRQDVLKEVLDPKEFTTWVDSLAVAAGALARDKAGYPISKIAEELGRTEATIRNHLQGKTKAGKLVLETYDMLKRGKLQLAIPVAGCDTKELEELRAKLSKVKETLEKLLEELK